MHVEEWRRRNDLPGARNYEVDRQPVRAWLLSILTPLGWLMQHGACSALTQRAASSDECAKWIEVQQDKGLGMDGRP